MNIKRITLLCAALGAAPAAVFAEGIQIYGTANADLESVKAEGGATQSFGSRSRVTSNGSNLGFRAHEDLGGGLTAFFQFESAVNFDNGTASGYWGSRNSAVGLRGGLGELLLGQWDSPYKYSTSRIDPFNGVSIAAYTGILGGTGAVTGGQGGSTFAERASFERRVSNVVNYASPSWHGLTGRFAYGTGDTNVGSSATGVAESTGLRPALFAAAAIYDAGALYLTAAFEEHKDFQALNTLLGAAPSGGRDRAWKAGGQYALLDNRLTLGAIFERLEYRADDIGGLGSLERKVDNWFVSAKYTMDRHAFALSYGHKGEDKLSGAGFSDVPESKASQIAARYGYSFSKRTQLYAMATRISNEANAAQTFGNSPLAPTQLFRDPARGADPTGFGVGMIHSF